MVFNTPLLSQLELAKLEDDIVAISDLDAGVVECFSKLTMPKVDARRLVERRAALIEVVEDVHDVESAERVNVGQLQRRHDGEVP